ncbi:hypothetical protein AVEN_236686-1 [Araneus ventricosus]|uniref:Uncharacterized protein n=1 Tax=Araneus ventricosus TaxID=182803 RepID=A0A4Y2T9D0_ARAVE|nr:hypothetical protein AVEN_236686-1 [Araneus ventricosus]
MTFVIRFVWCIIGAEPRMEEHFLESIPIEHSIGDSLIEKILVQLEETKNPQKNMLGQSYDNRAKKERNKSKYSNRILNINSSGILCATHSINLVLIEVPQPRLDAVEFLGIL